MPTFVNGYATRSCALYSVRSDGLVMFDGLPKGSNVFEGGKCSR